MKSFSNVLASRRSEVLFQYSLPLYGVARSRRAIINYLVDVPSAQVVPGWSAFGFLDARPTCSFWGVYTGNLRVTTRATGI